MGAAKKLDRMPEELYLEETIRDGRATKQELSMKHLKPDTRFQARELHLDMDHVLRLSRMKKDGTPLYPIIVFFDGKRYIVADGFHRHEAARRDGDASITAWVIECAPSKVETEAMMYATMCNRLAILGRKKPDIHRAIWMMLENSETYGWSNRRIANHVGCADQTVITTRLEFCRSNGVTPPSMVVDQVGRTRPAKLSSTTKVRPISINPAGYHSVSIDGKNVMLGKDSNVAEATKASLEKDRENKLAQIRRPITDWSSWFSRRDLLMVSPGIANSHLDGHHRFGCICGHGFVCVAVDFDTQAIALVVGEVLMARAAVDSSLNPVVLCYPETGPAKAMQLAKTLGIEFLTPEELVNRIKVQQAQKPPSDPST